MNSAMQHRDVPSANVQSPNHVWPDDPGSPNNQAAHPPEVIGLARCLEGSVSARDPPVRRMSSAREQPLEAGQDLTLKTQFCLPHTSRSSACVRGPHRVSD